jgi:hypothetical protein
MMYNCTQRTHRVVRLNSFLNAANLMCMMCFQSIGHNRNGYQTFGSYGQLVEASLERMASATSRARAWSHSTTCDQVSGTLRVHIVKMSTTLLHKKPCTSSSASTSKTVHGVSQYPLLLSMASPCRSASLKPFVTYISTVLEGSVLVPDRAAACKARSFS